MQGLHEAFLYARIMEPRNSCCNSCLNSIGEKGT
jgi:hypothetical protein